MNDPSDNTTLPDRLAQRAVLSAFYGDFSELHAIQEQAFQPIYEGQDALITSPTGSGKTEAAVTPLIARWFRALRADSGPVVLYVSPTKALVNDLHARLSRPCTELGISIGVRHGDRSDLSRSRPPGLLITTPESLDVLLARGDTFLAGVRSIVIDEIHLLYNAQRGLQLSVLLGRLERLVRRQVQVVSMSATIADTHELLSFFFGSRSARTPVVVRNPERKQIRSHVRLLKRASELAELIARIAGQRAVKLLVFANSRRVCDELGAMLTRTGSQLPKVFVHHSSLSTADREETERNFARERRAICIATSTLELGIDIGDVDAVVLYGVPPSLESFLQRIGRGCRRSDESNVVCLVPPDSRRPLLDLFAYLAIIRRAGSGAMECDRAFSLFGAAVQQILSHLKSLKGAFVKTTDFTELFSSHAHLGQAAILEILSELGARGVLLRHDYKERFAAGVDFHRLESLRLIYGNYSAGSQTVTLRWHGRDVGRISTFNLLRLEPGKSFTFGGRIYRVKQIDRDRVEVELGTQKEKLVSITYLGTGPGLHPHILEDVLALLLHGEIDEQIVAAPDRPVLSRTVQRLRPLLSDGLVPVFSSPKGLCHFTLAGAQFNRALAAWSSGEISKADDICVVANSHLPLATLPESLDALPSQTINAERSLFQSMLPPELAEREERQVWLKTNAHVRTLARLRSGKSYRVDPAGLEGLF